MNSNANKGRRDREETKARIIEVAKQVFSEKGYSQAGLREIAARSNVAGSLLVKYFDTKANLFETALTMALIDPRLFQSDRSHFGEAIVQSIDEPKLSVLAPAMIALSLGDNEAMAVIAKVSREHILDPVASWLGPPDAGARASFILMLTTGYAIFGRHIAMHDSEKVRRRIAKLVSRALQAAVDEN